MGGPLQCTSTPACAISPSALRRRVKPADVEFFELRKGPGQGFKVYPRLWPVLRRLQPAVVHTRNLGPLEMQVAAALAGWKPSLQVAADALEVLDVTRRIAGTGSLGVERLLVLVKGDDAPWLLEVKEVRGSAYSSKAASADQLVSVMQRVLPRPPACFGASRLGRLPVVITRLGAKEDKLGVDELPPEALESYARYLGFLVGEIHRRGASTRWSAASRSTRTGAWACRRPAEGRLHAGPVLQPASADAGRPRPGRPPIHAKVEPQHLLDLEADGEDRIERSHRVLKDEADPGTADRAEVVFGAFQKIGAVEHHVAAADIGGRRGQKADQRHHRHRLA